MFGRRLDYYKLTEPTKQRVEQIVTDAGLDNHHVRLIFTIEDRGDGSHALHVTQNLMNDQGHPYIADYASCELASRPVVIPLSADDFVTLMRDLPLAAVTR